MIGLLNGLTVDGIANKNQFLLAQFCQSSLLNFFNINTIFFY